MFTCDGYNRMRSAETFGETTSFSYDALGRRIAKRSSHATTLFGWDGDTLAFESTQSTEGRQEDLGRGDSVHYIHEPGSFVPLLQIRQAQAVALSQTTDVKALIAANGGRYDIEQDPLWNGQQLRTPQAFAKEEIAFYQCDHLGTPQELTDHEGGIAWSASYKAWGEAKQAISEAGRKAGFRNPIRFQGQYFDDETGLHYNRYRYYDPRSGRFVSSDPIGRAGGLNFHQYTPNPIEWIDPLGLAAGKACIHWHDNRGPGNAFGHYSVEVEADGKKLHTHQLGAPGTETMISDDLSGVVAPTKSRVVDLPDATAAQDFQKKNLNQIGGAYDTKTRSCVTHVGDVLRAGGVTMPTEPGAQFKHLKKLGL